MRKRNTTTRSADRIREYPGKFLTILWIISSVIIAFLGPFGTFENFSFLERLSNWSFAIGMSIVIGLVVNRAVQMVLGPDRNRFLYDLIAFPAFMALYVPMLYTHVTLYPLVTIELPLSFIASGVFCVGIGLIALRELMGLYLDQHPLPEAAAQAPDAQPEAPQEAETAPLTLMARLPEAVRGDLITISGANHYVEVRTARGDAQLLLRFSDAMREIGSEPGLQVHRSHWVADRAVSGLVRENGRFVVLMRCGNRVPVARSQVPSALDRWPRLKDQSGTTLSA